MAQPLDIELVIVPLSGAVDSVSGQVEADEGLELVDGASIARHRQAGGCADRAHLKVLPKREGIFTLRVIVSVDSAGQTSSQTFSIPLIAGAGIAAPPKPAAAPRRQPRASLPAAAAQ